MPGALNIGNPPGIRTPGAGPNGPLGVDARRPITSVGHGSSVPYGPTNGYATPNGVTGFVGPAAGSLQKPTAWYVRVGGSDTNGGTSISLTPDRTGTDGSFPGGTTTFSSATGNFTKADIGAGIWISVGQLFKIVAVTNSTTVTLNTNASGSGFTWNLGGSFATPSAIFGNSQGPILTGDTVYIGAGTYRKTYSVQFADKSFNGIINVVGDVTGQYTGDAGMVQLTAYTTNDKTAPSASALLNLNGKSNLSFSNIMFVAGTGVVVQANLGGNQNITFVDCSFQSASQAINFLNSANQAANWRIDKCVFFAPSGTNGAIALFLTTVAGPDYDVNFTITNSVVYGAGTPCVLLAASGVLAGKGGGVIIRNCLLIAAGQIAVSVNTANLSTIYPCSVRNSFLPRSTTGLSANTLGQIVEDYNLISAGTPRANVSVGSHSISDNSYAQLFHFGQERIWGGLLRRFGEPMANSPLLGFGNDGGQTLYDLANGPRPSGGASALPAVGALERSNTSVQATSPVPTSGTHVWQFTGPAYQDFLLPVSAVASGFSIQVQRDANYAVWPGGSNSLPAVLLLANPTIGVAAQTVVDTGVDSQWNTLTLSNFTPTGTGWVTVRIASYDGSGASVVSFAVAAPT